MPTACLLSLRMKTRANKRKALGWHERLRRVWGGSQNDLISTPQKDSWAHNWLKRTPHSHQKWFWLLLLQKKKNLAVFSQKNRAHHYGWKWEHGLPWSNEKFHRDWRRKLPSHWATARMSLATRRPAELGATDRLQLRFPVTLSVFILCACTHTCASIRGVTHR